MTTLQINKLRRVENTQAFEVHLYDEGTPIDSVTWPSFTITVALNDMPKPIEDKEVAYREYMRRVEEAGSFS